MRVARRQGIRGRGGWRRWLRHHRRPTPGPPLLALGLVAGLLASLVATPGPAAASTITPVDKASTSTRGIFGKRINVVFPVSNLDALASQLGFAGDVEYSEQSKAIRLFVGYINEHGGINGRKINPIIVNFDPTNDAEMRALCKDWTEGSPAAFAVLDGVGTYTGDNELCVTEEGHTPMLSQWTTITNWTNQGSPYLWWTGPDQAVILQAIVDYGLSAGLLGSGHKLGIIAGDRASDQTALHQYLLPDLAQAGIRPVVSTIAADPNETSETTTEAPLVVQRMRSDGVKSIIPLMPFNSFFPVLQAETQQQYFPKLLLSDYEESIETALGLIPVPYAKALNGQVGVTTETLGGLDGPEPQSEGGYDPGDRWCWNIWHKAYPQTPKGNANDYIEEQGPVQGWCQEIHLFATAATNAGKNLNRRTFVEAMSRIKNYPGGYSTTFSFGPDKFYGPSEYQVVKLRVNSPPSPLCKGRPGKPPVGTCWVTVQGWRPLPK
jgi:hypothetical protein